MKMIRSCKALTVISLAAAFCALARGADVREEFHQVYPLDKQGHLQLENVNGHVHIKTWDKQEVKVDAVKRAKTQQHLDDVKIDVQAATDHIRIKTQYPPGNKNNSTTVEYTLTVPKASRLDKIATVNGAVEIEGASGAGEITTVNGAITATGLSGGGNLSTVNGAVNATFATVDTGVSLKTVNGSVTLALPDGANADLSAQTVHGAITTDFDLNVKKEFPVGQKLQGKLGKGGPAVSLSAVNGSIQIERSK